MQHFLQEGTPPTDEELWRFLRAFDFASLDLNTSGSVVETSLRSLLAATAIEGGAATATASWNELLALVGARSGTSFRREQLPETLHARHRPNGGVALTGLERSREDSAIVVRGIHPRIGGQVSLPRRELVEELCRLLETGQVVLAVGEPGVGKSVVAKAGFEVVGQDGLALAFRAESFAAAHVNQALSTHGLTLGQLNTHFAMHRRKVLWVESVERLLEKPERVAFRDLLLAVKADPTWKLIVTCRDYSAETVRSAFFEDVGLACDTVRVRGLTDEELDEVAARLPALARPLAAPHLRRLLSVPFQLDKAARLSWPADEPLPRNEREFRAKVWDDVIRCNAEPAGDLPRLRAAVFEAIALRRARALEPFVSGEDLSPDALYRLRRDGLLVSPQNDDGLLAPAHDVLEDWALMRWLERGFQSAASHDLRGLWEKVGTHPALRRAYRRWLTESLDVDPSATDALVLDAVQDPAVCPRTGARTRW